MRSNRIVVIGASAGGIEALQGLASQLPSDFAAPLCVVVHTAPDSPGLLPAILNRAGPLPAEHARDGLRMHAGHFYIAPADYHLLVEPGTLRLTKGPRENRFRPAVDPLGALLTRLAATPVHEAARPAPADLESK
jgi:two-component system, chemotaxis family, protein-glutamate methylesterase/glutaminase